MSVTFLGDTLKTSSHPWTVPTHSYTDTTLDLFRLPVVSQETISVHLRWETLGLIGHISSFFVVGTVDLVAKVSCQKAFILSDQPVAALTMPDCSLQLKPCIQTLTSGTNLPVFPLCRTSS